MMMARSLMQSSCQSLRLVIIGIVEVNVMMLRICNLDTISICADVDTQNSDVGLNKTSHGNEHYSGVLWETYR